jgi:predicted Zn-dependent peptidase
VERNVPADVIYLAWHICPRHDRNFYTLDVLTDILAGGESGRLYSSLVRDKKLFSDINGYLTGDIEPGLLIINGKLMDGVSFETAEEAINGIVEELKNTTVPGKEIEKVRNKFEASQVFSNTNVQTKAMNLGFFELLGDANQVNSEIQLFNSVDTGKVMEAARYYLSQENCSALTYRSLKTGGKK